MDYIFKKFLFRMFILGVVLCLVIAYNFLYTDDFTKYGGLIHFKEHVKKGDVIFRNAPSTDGNVGIIDIGMFGKVYVWDDRNTIKSDLYDWAKKSENSHVTVYRILSADVKPHEMSQREIDSLSHMFKIEFIIKN